MSDDHKDRVKRAIAIYSESQKPKTTRKNEKPEKGVELACVRWMQLMKWDVQIFEAKATRSISGHWRQQAMKAGTADCGGNMPDGHAVAIEFKAPGRLASFALERNARQQEYLSRKIESGVFACVTDSLDRLVLIHKRWRELIDKGLLDAAKQYLFEMLPKQKKPRSPAKPPWEK